MLVLKAGAEGESPCVLGTVQEPEWDAPLRPGEVRLKGGGSAIHLGQDRLELSGQLYLNGQSLRDAVAAIVASLL